MNIREAAANDFDRIWPFFQPIASAGDTCAYPRDISKQEAQRLWMHVPVKTFVAEDWDGITGAYYIKTNHAGPGSHVCNCGYMVPAKARGKGVGAIMCEHSQKIALELGYKAMQFNFVAASNELAVHLWTRLGFKIVGRLPKAFNHPQKGYIDALIMYKWLEDH
ncbi:MAG: N-acetyltransferase family protein [Desulfonatronovibrionaceae bacterium]